MINIWKPKRGHTEKNYERDLTHGVRGNSGLLYNITWNDEV